MVAEEAVRDLVRCREDAPELTLLRPQLLTPATATAASAESLALANGV